MVKFQLNDNTILGIVAGISLGIAIVALILYMKKQESPSASEPGVMYTYDEMNRLQSVTPLSQNMQFVRLKQAG